ncbi:hypothetical protein [Streptomyces camelliae]|uniref:hypothetical protein n=1 Tax=Streptomyces camelliae TaxID=3004093 RepID=UPI003D17200C
MRQGSARPEGARGTARPATTAPQTPDGTSRHFQRSAQVGLPTDLPYVDFGAGLFAFRPDEVHWKTEAIVAYADGRPFAWVDDEQSPAHIAYVAAHHPGPALLHHVDPRVGLREADFAALREFAAALPA